MKAQNLNPEKEIYSAVSESKFYQDVLDGLSAEFKHLSSKYFYDEKGDKLFQEIMSCPEYYLTRCETEIFSQQTAAIADVISMQGEPFDIIELGAGDGTKTIHLLKYLVKQGKNFQYLPVDISDHILAELELKMKNQIPELSIKTLNGEYFEMLAQATKLSSRRKIVLFLGSNIGNMPVREARQFCKSMREALNPGDLVLMGFDLVKNPKVILAAYNDTAGITREFNLNLLRRINNELDADFKIDSFDHYCTYDPATGSCKSYLVSLREQVVNFPSKSIRFQKDESIWMEISQKYSLLGIKQIAAATSFTTVNEFTDSKEWFADVIWRAE
jgi:L-histidine Nalpha-methyltransferase